MHLNQAKQSLPYKITKIHTLKKKRLHTLGLKEGSRLVIEHKQKNGPFIIYCEGSFYMMFKQWSQWIEVEEWT